MHRSVQEHLERYLRGSGQPSGGPEFDAHLGACEGCRREVEALGAQSRLLRTLAPGAEIEASPGFYASVMSAIDVRRRRSVGYALLDPAFGRRLVYACLATVLLLGSFLIYALRTPAFDAFNPVAIMAADAVDQLHVGDGDNPQLDRELVLLSLASYQE